MEIKEFKNIFSDIAKSNHLKKNFGGWFTESDECILMLDLQKSNFSNIYYLNIKIYIQGAFGNIYIPSKELLKIQGGDVFRRTPPDFNDVFDLSNHMNDLERNKKLNSLFDNFIMPFTTKALTKSGLKQLSSENQVVLLPAIKEELYK
ncbi:DUF4304 domain-containing protein [Mucilaginibacter panaciglaebae]|uniref:DUF4304 domain-containing protein n=1 Tax=Mucilaginibacter panaciglaebae TaxID=502331 RepID=A0ABP7X8J0_9SPHI